MIIRRFLQWTTTAPADARAEGAAALARAYVDGEFDAAECRDAEAVMTALLDDVAPAVRRAMALELAASPATPHAIVTALAADNAEIAALVLERSPVLSVPELVDAAAVGDAVTQAAIARRTVVEVGLAAALAEVAGLPACLCLCQNLGADIPERSLVRMIERFGDDAAFRDAVGARPGLPAALRHRLVVDTARQLQALVTGCGWLSADRAARAARDAVDGAAVTLGADAFAQAGAPGVAALTRHLRRTGCLTPALILRAALCGHASFVEAAFSELSGMPPQRVAGLLTRAGLGFHALYAKTGLPASLEPALLAAIQRGAGPHDATAAPQRERIGRALASVGGGRDGAGGVTALLRRLDAEAAREQARAFAQDLLEDSRTLRLPRPSSHDRCLPLSSAA